MKPEVKKTIHLYCGFQVFFSLLLWLPVFYDFQKRIGLSDNEIFGIQSIYYLVFCLLEIPTGLIADHWGHRNSMRVGAVTVVVSNLFPIFAQSYAGMLTHFLLIALARSLISGAASAYLYDYLKAHGASDRYKSTEGNARAYGLIAKVVLWAGIGAVMQWNLTIPYWLTFATTSLSLFFAWKLPILRIESQARGNVLADFRPLVGFFRSVPMLPLVMIQGISLFVLARILQVNLFQPLLGQKGFSIASYGAVMSLMTVFEAVGAMLPRKGKGWFTDLDAVFWLTIGMAMSLLVVQTSGILGVLSGLSLFSLIIGVAFPIQRQLLNDTIPDSRYRATLLSVESIIDRAVCAWVAFLIPDYVSTGRSALFLGQSALATLAAMTVLYVVIRFSVRSRRVAALRVTPPA